MFFYLQGLHVQNVVGVVQGGLLVVEGREAHALEVVPVALLPPHHDPHRAPLGMFVCWVGSVILGGFGHVCEGLFGVGVWGSSHDPHRAPLFGGAGGSAGWC